MTPTPNTFTYFGPATRLDKALAAQYSDYSRTYFQELIEQGCVTVNNKKITVAKTEVIENDIISFTLTPRPTFNLTPHKVDFQVIDVQPDFVVINKPAGLLVHAPSNRSQEITLVNGLLYLFSDMRELLEHDDRPGIVHRIDEDTSGLLLVARNERGKTALMRMFHDRLINKSYKAIVRGHAPANGTINFPIGRHPTVRNKMTHQSLNGRPATSLFTVDRYLKDATLLNVKIITGRTHQIRVHCAAIGHPILGDSLYGIQTPHIKRQALHAFSLEFTYDGKHFAYQAPLPLDMTKLIEKLESSEFALD